jgi:hypothetical protein
VRLAARLFSDPKVEAQNTWLCCGVSIDARTGRSLSRPATPHEVSHLVTSLDRSESPKGSSLRFGSRTASPRPRRPSENLGAPYRSRSRNSVSVPQHQRVTSRHPRRNMPATDFARNGAFSRRPPAWSEMRLETVGLRHFACGSTAVCGHNRPCFGAGRKAMRRATSRGSDRAQLRSWSGFPRRAMYRVAPDRVEARTQSGSRDAALWIRSREHRRRVSSTRARKRPARSVAKAVQRFRRFARSSRARPRTNAAAAADSERLRELRS